MRRVVAAFFGLTALVAAALPLGAWADPPNDFHSDNVTFVKNLPINGDGVGAKVIGHYLYMTTSNGLWIYDVSDPPNPVLVSGINLAVHWENEEVPTNGRILGLSDSGTGFLISVPSCEMAPLADQLAHPAMNCLALYDVHDPTHPTYLSAVFGAGNHTSACIYDCTYFWGSRSAVSDARDPKNPKLLCAWFDASTSPAQITVAGGKTIPFVAAPHHVREVAPGIILTASQPILLLSVRPEDGGNICRPALIAEGTNPDGRFIHSNRWPNSGTDKFALIGGETNGNAQCDVENPGAFMVWDAQQVNDHGSDHFVPGTQFKMLSEYRVSTGTYTDGQPPVTVLGCSVHWFEEHPTFKNGGLVALAAYEAGTRFLQITPSGDIREVGWYVPVGRGSTSAPHWAPDGKTVYTIDYERGFDVLQWTGPLYVPRQDTTSSGGTGGASTGSNQPPSAAPNAATSQLPGTSGGPVGWLAAAVLISSVGVLARYLQKTKHNATR